MEATPIISSLPCNSSLLIKLDDIRTDSTLFFFLCFGNSFAFTIFYDPGHHTHEGPNREAPGAVTNDCSINRIHTDRKGLSAL